MKTITFLRTMALAGLMLLTSVGWGQESIIYTTGFEAAEEFSHGTVYNNTTIKYDGPEEQQWGTYYGTASTTGAISGGQSMQMRWYTSAPSNLGYTFTDFDLANVTKVDFLASSTNNISVEASYSTDGGINYTGEEVFILTNTATEYTYNISAIGEFSDVRIKFTIVLPTPAPGGTSRLYIDDIIVYGITGGPVPPSISNITQTPETDITSATTVSVSADITEGDAAIQKVELHWGTVSGDYPNTVTMTVTASKSLNYNTVEGIPAQADGTTVYYVVYAEDEDEESATSAEQSYQVRDPRFTTLPYEETFDSDLGDCYVYSVSGDDYFWAHGSFGGNGYAQMNGFGSTELEEDWLILPGIDLYEYENVVLTFESVYRYHSILEGNEFELLYSTDYTGIGNPNLATWTELEFNRPVLDAWTFVPSGNVELPDLDEIIWIGFKYKYDEQYPTWQIDNIHIFEADTPLLSVVPTSLTGFSYLEDNGPSDSQSFTISGLALEPEAGDITITGSENFEVSTDDETFEAAVQLPYSGGVLSETFVYTRLKAGLDAGIYAGETIGVTGGGAATETVTASGEVLAPPPGLPYQEDFSGFISTETLPEDWFVSNTSYNGDWGTGTGAGLRGNASVLGFQHTSGTGTFTASITLINNTGSIINQLYISYLGMVERAGEGRSPEWTVELNGTEIPELFYSTSGGVDETKSVLITDLSIEENEVFTISWSSERGVPSGSSKQIGISNVFVNTSEPNFAETPTFNPPAGTYYEPQDVEISSATEGATIEYSLIGEEGPWTTYTDPIGVATTTTLWAYASKDGMDDSPVSSAVYTFPGVVEVDDIAALRANAEARSETAYKVTGEVVLTFQSANRNVKYIQDATAAILIDDPGGIIISTYNVYDGVTGITGTLGYYESMLQFTPVLDPGPATSVNNEIVPEEVTLDALTEAYQAKLVKINAVSIAGSGNFAESTNYTITDPSGSGVLRTAYTDLNYIDTPIPEVAQDITAVVLQYQTTLQLVPRSQDDFEDTVFEVDPPQSFTAATFSESRIDLTFESNTANDDVVIVYNATNTFSEPVGAPPDSGEAFAGGTLLYAGTDSPQSHTGLSTQETVYYKAWAYDGANYSPGLTSDATTYASEPSNHVTDFMASTTFFNSITLSWEVSDAAAYLIKGSTISFGDIADPVDGVPEADGGLVANVEAETESHEFTGLAPDTEHFFKIFPYNGSGALINYKTDGEVPQANATTEALPTEYFVDFEGEGETKTSYGQGVVNLSGLDWDMTEALIGTASSDIKNDARAARLRLDSGVYGTMTMLEDKQNGIGTITLLYSRSNFSGDRTGTSPTFVVEYSIDAGDTWNQAGDETNLADINTLTEFSAVVNVPGDIRIRIRQISGDAGKRWNVDDIFLTDYEGVPTTLPLSGITIYAEDDECYAASESIEASDFVVESGGAATFVTGPAGYIRFMEGVEVQLNGYLRAWIDPDENYCNQVASMLAITEEEVIEEQLPAIRETASFFKVYPNPVAQSFTLELRETEGSSSIAIEIYSIMGEQLLRKELPQTALYRVDVQSLPRGMYIVRVMQGDKTGVQRIIKQ